MGSSRTSIVTSLNISRLKTVNLRPLRVALGRRRPAVVCGLKTLIYHHTKNIDKRGKTAKQARRWEGKEAIRPTCRVIKDESRWTAG